MKKILALVAAAVLLLVIVEAGSSYVIYRHFSTLRTAYYPSGSATLSLARFTAAKARGRRDEAELTIDHGPLFRSDPKLGYTLLPGAYRITEKRGGQTHAFTLTVDSYGRRIASFHPNGAARRMYIAGDSGLFGWGLNDEQAIPWLLQTRFPSFDVINLSLTSYSTIHALYQLDATRPAVAPDDIVMLTYHPITNGFNVVSAEMLFYLDGGFEQKLGDPELLHHMMMPSGSVVAGELKISPYAAACGKPSNDPACARHTATKEESIQVSVRVFDAIQDAHPAHYIVAWLSGPDDDQVIAHLRSRGMTIADLRTVPSDPDASDEVAMDGHAGPFWHHMQAERLAAVLHETHWTD
jgi:hypothetical protein